MPSEKAVGKIGFLRKQLIDGRKAFRYRQGVRALLGIPEVTEDLLHFARPLPARDFRALNASPADTEEMPIQSSGPEVSERLPQNAFPDYGGHLKKTESETFPVGLQSRHPFKSDPPGLEMPKQKIHTRLPLQSRIADPAGDHHAAPQTTPTEQAQVDIPGCSKPPASFPALRPVKDGNGAKVEEASPSSAFREKRPERKINDPEKGERASSIHFKNEPFTEQVRVKPDKEISNSGQARPDSSYGQASQEHAIKQKKEDDDEKKAASRLLQTFQPAMRSRNATSTRPDVLEAFARPSAPLGDVSPDSARPSRLDAAAQIKALRQTLQILKSKRAAASEQEADIEAKDRRSKTQVPQTPPVVIMKQVRPQVTTPAAFWERRYLSHAALRLRILR